MLFLNSRTFTIIHHHSFNCYSVELRFKLLKVLRSHKISFSTLRCNIGLVDGQAPIIYKKAHMKISL
uniref:Uncharacterized protein n=1 Tax=Rhizophora mucronata TaxID=61149 RepID=A0A2P2PQG9_RHIMU